MRVCAAIMAIIVFTLTMGFGLVTLYSVADFDRFINQCMFFGFSLIPAIVVCFVNPSYWVEKRWRRVALIALIIVGLLCVHIPGLGKTELKGGIRWINFRCIGMPWLSFQPSEAVKVAVVILLSWWMSDPARKTGNRRELVTKPMIGLGVVIGGLLLQKDLGSCIMVTAVVVPMMLIGGARIRHLILWCLPAVLCLSFYMASSPARLGRFTTWWKVNITSTARNEEGEETVKEYHPHIAQSRLALKKGKLTGDGLGSSIYKKEYVPEYETDFILAMIGEEMGFIGIAGVLSLYLMFFMLGCAAAANASDLFMAFSAFGLTLHICLSAGVNAAMITGIIPTKGLALPFVSYGGSCLLFSITAAAFVVSICGRAKYRPRRKPNENFEGGGRLLSN